MRAHTATKHAVPVVVVANPFPTFFPSFFLFLFCSRHPPRPTSDVNRRTHTAHTHSRALSYTHAHRTRTPHAFVKPNRALPTPLQRHTVVTNVALGGQRLKHARACGLHGILHNLDVTGYGTRYAPKASVSDSDGEESETTGQFFFGKRGGT